MHQSQLSFLSVPESEDRVTTSVVGQLNGYDVWKGGLGHEFEYFAHFGSNGKTGLSKVGGVKGQTLRGRCLR